MAVSDLTKLAFGNDPKVGLEVIDAYDAKAIGSLLSDPEKGIDSLANAFPGLKLDKVSDLIKDVQFQSFLKKNNLSLDGFLKDLTKALPFNVDINDVLGEFEIADLFGFLGGLREYLPSTSWNGIAFDNLKTMFDGTKRYFDMFSEGMDWSDFLSGWSDTDWNWGIGKTGWKFPDFIGTAVNLDLAKKMIAAGKEKELMAMLEESDMPEELKQQLMADLIGTAADAGLTDLVKELIVKAGPAFKPWQYAATIKRILGGFLLEPGTSVTKLPEQATGLVDLCSGLEKEWYLTKRAGVKVGNTEYLKFATDDAIKTLKYDDRTEAVAVCFDTYRPVAEDWRGIASRHCSLLTF